MKTLRRLMIPLAIFILVRILFQFNFFSNLEHRAQDSLFRIRGAIPVSDSLVIVAIDDVTFQDLQLSWPFPRELHARLIDNLVQAGAKQIIFDIEFTEYSNPWSDAVLAVSAANAGNVIMAGKYFEYADNPDHKQIQKPIQPILAEQINWGIVNMPKDLDGFVREYRLFEEMGDEKYYAIGIAALANSRMYQPDWQQGISYSGKTMQVANFRIPVINEKNTRLNYFGPANTFPHFSFSNVLDDSTMLMAGIDLDQYYELLEREVFKDKIVLIGATISELHDEFHTPFSSRMTAGVEIHANFLEMVSSGRYLYNVNFWLFCLVELLIAIIMYFLLSWLKPNLSLLIVIILIAVILVSSYVLFSRFGMLIPIVERVILLGLLYMAALLVHYIRSQKEKKFIKNAFQQYLAPELVNELLKNPKNLKYGGTQQEITVLFSDIRSFTTYAEKHQPEETVQILKEYLTAMVDTIKNNGGIVDKFVGDEIMALYGTPIPHAEHALQACRTALDMRQVLVRMQQKWRAEGREDFEIGIGINTGSAVVGNLGSEQIFDYTAIGDTINLGARLEGLNKEYEAAKKIIINESTYNQVKDRVEARFLAEVKVKGKDIPVRIYELLGLK
ncbi:MAG: adenylate/guanylate cyclase domain-containing protein [Candidatus Cloacimonadaceae bacterium]